MLLVNKTIMADSEADVCYFAISNIPASFRSATLRNYFSQFIESGGFHCFHYRHRPEVLREAEEGPRRTADEPTESPLEGERSGDSTASETTAAAGEGNLTFLNIQVLQSIKHIHESVQNVRDSIQKKT